MKSFFPYYGGKWRAAKHYSKPKYACVVEPFAGAAGYSTYYDVPNACLYDKDPAIVAVWSFLIAAKESEILNLPLMQPGESVEYVDAPADAKLLIGYWLNPGSAVPKRTMLANDYAKSSGSRWGVEVRARIAAQVHKIKNWTVQLASYDFASDIDATWFIDPPYADKGKYYRHKKIDYTELGAWCKTRKGQVIVCENAGVNWLPFKYLNTITGGVPGKKSVEVIWTNDMQECSICRSTHGLEIQHVCE